MNNPASQGCRICQKGGWVCIYLTYRCPARCHFCTAPLKNTDVTRSDYGDTPESILSRLKDTDVRGISFSGGDCFSVFGRLIEWLRCFHVRYPDAYYWAYTSGITVNREQLKQLAGAGLNELRFNIAATGYHDAVILKRIEAAVSILQHVAVEIPSIPRDYSRLTEVLPELDMLGVHYLNLHEYILEPSDPLYASSPKTQVIFNHDMALTVHSESIENSRRIQVLCEKQKLKMHVHSCTMALKENQMRHRRREMATRVQEKFEIMTEEGFLETILVHPGSLSDAAITDMVNGMEKKADIFVRPDCYRPDAAFNGTAARLTCLPPVSVHDRRKLLRISRMD